MIETKQCNDCGREFTSENEEDLNCAICGEPMDFKEALGETPEVKAYLVRVQEERETFMEERLRGNLTSEDWIKFKEYQKLNEYFSGGDDKKVEFLQDRTSYNESRFGVKVYGTEHWMIEKEFFGMDGEAMPKVTYSKDAEQ